MRGKEQFKITLEVQAPGADTFLFAEQEGNIHHSPTSDAEPLTVGQMTALKQGLIEFAMTYATNLRNGKRTVIKTER